MSDCQHCACYWSGDPCCHCHCRAGEPTGILGLVAGGHDSPGARPLGERAFFAFLGKIGAVRWAP